MIDETETSANSDPAQASHQRLLALRYDDVQKRLIDNKTLLTKLENPGLKQLDTLILNLKKRVDKDKELLLCVNEIKKMDRDVDLKEWYRKTFFSSLELPHKTFISFRPAAKIIMDFSRGCKSVLSLMETDVTSTNTEDSGSGSDGYHSESETDERK